MNPRFKYVRTIAFAAAAVLGGNRAANAADYTFKVTHAPVDDSVQSVERLMTFLTALDRDVEISIKKKPRSRSVGRITVIAA
ncbi:MAG: hypothetical protein KGI68_14155 [Alphaproteobacteria bacterium]|nr:hypothetical protein [Alphaproteobacteria bacterium]